MTKQAVTDSIIAATKARGENPAYALAVAERERFNPGARSSKTIAGIYQMRGDLRAKYGTGDSPDPWRSGDGERLWMLEMISLSSVFVFPQSDDFVL